MRTVADTIAESLTARGADAAFTLIGTGNFPYTQTLKANGVEIYRARHENGAISMATAWARVTGRVGICTLSKGAGLTHGLTALVEAKKSHTPLLVLAADTPADAVYSSPAVPQAAVVNAAGVLADRLHSPETAAADIERAYRRAERTRQPVVLNIATDVVKMDAAEGQPEPFVPPLPAPPAPAAEAVADAVDLIVAARRPVLLAGAGVGDAESARAVRALGQRIGALLSTSILAHGLFAGEPTSLGISGGYARAETVEVMGQADLVLAFGASLNDWTTRAGSLLAAARVVHVDLDPSAFGRHHPVDVAVQADAGATARALLLELDRREAASAAPWSPTRTPAPAQDARGAAGGGRLGPRALTEALNELLPRDRNVAIDGGGCLEQAVGLEPGGPRGFLFPITYMSIGLGLASGVGAAIAAPKRLTVIALGDACTLSALADLETVARLNLPLLIVIYNDAAHGGEREIFTRRGYDVDLLEFPDVDFAALAAGVGIQGATVRSLDDLGTLSGWLEDRRAPLLLDAKIGPESQGDEMFSATDPWTARLMRSQGL